MFGSDRELACSRQLRHVGPKSRSRKCAATELRTRCDLLEARFAGALKKASRAETTVCASLSTKSLSRQDYCADPSEQATPTAEAQSSILRSLALSELQLSFAAISGIR